MHLTTYAMLLEVWNELMRAWMNEYSYKEIVGFGNVTLMTQVTGFEELLSDMSNRNPRSSFMMGLA